MTYLKYLSKQVNGFDTRNNFIRSMDIKHAYDVKTALQNYESVYFASERKQYLNEAFKRVQENSLFWPKHVFTDMLDEIAMNNENYDVRVMMKDIDHLKSLYLIWASKRKSQPVTTEVMISNIKSFETKYKYRCPDTYKSAWMNTGAYITLSYGIKYENIRFPKCTTAEESLSLLQKLALEVISDMNHDVDTRLFEVCHAVYLQKMTAI